MITTIKKELHDATTVTIAPDPNPNLGVGRSGFTLVVDFVIQVSLSLFFFYFFFLEVCYFTTNFTWQVVTSCYWWGRKVISIISLN